MSEQRIKEQLAKIERHKNNPKLKGVYSDCAAALRRKLLYVVRGGGGE